MTSLLHNVFILFFHHNEYYQSFQYTCYNLVPTPFHCVQGRKNFSCMHTHSRGAGNKTNRDSVMGERVGGKVSEG